MTLALVFASVVGSFSSVCHAMLLEISEWRKEHPFRSHSRGDSPCFQVINPFSSFMLLWLFS